MGKCSQLLLAILVPLVAVTACTCRPMTEPVLLRFAPTVGEPIAYKISVNLDKTTNGRPSNENVSAVTVMTPTAREGDGYRVAMTVHLSSHNLDDLLAEHMEQKANAKESLTISDALVFSGEDGPSLHLPEHPVGIGDSWEAEDVYKVGDLLTLEPPTVRWRFTVNRLAREGGRTLAHIGVKLLTGESEAPFQIGQAGIRCNEDGKVLELSGDAAGKLRVGDRVVAIGGTPAPNPRTRSILAQNFIEDLDLVDKPAQLTVERDGRALEVSVEKRVVSLGSITITYDDFERTSVFDADAGLLVSDDSAATFTFRYALDPQTEFLDDLRGRTETSPQAMSSESGEGGTQPRIYEYHWQMKALPVPGGE